MTHEPKVSGSEIVMTCQTVFPSLFSSAPPFNLIKQHNIGRPLLPTLSLFGVCGLGGRAQLAGVTDAGIPSGQ